MVDPTQRARQAIRIKNYKVEPLAGLLWAYLGPDPAPLVPNWEPFTWKNGFVQIVFSEVPCNWFQCQENSIDPVHFEWMHDNWSVRQKGTGPYSPRHLKVDFEEFDYGIQYKRIREGADESHPLWTIGRVCLWPYALFTGNHFEWRVPIDDDRTLSVTWFFSRVPKDKEPFVQKKIPYWYAPVKDPKTGRWITSHVMNQDFVAWVGQGTVADRTQEHLARSDRGIAMMRQRYLSDLKKIEAGEDPKATIRDASKNQCLDLPIAARKELTEGLEREYLSKTLTNKPLGGSGLRDFVWLTGQPEEVKQAYLEAMGYA
jgi:5,5'-dehydrodivanillate O-demethylase